MPEYFCQCCNFKTMDKTKYNRHTETSKHLELANVPTVVQVDIPKTDEIAELKAMILELSKTVIILNQKIDTLTIKVESQPIKIEQSQPIKIEESRPIKIEQSQPIKKKDDSESESESESEYKKDKPMSVKEEKQYILDTCEKLGDDALEWLNEYTPRQKKPRYEDPKNPYYIIDSFKYNLISKYLIDE